MNDVSFLECPNCGSTEFVEIAPHKHRCAYCGTVLRSRGRTPDLVRCPRCGFDNERADRYCNRCGAALVPGLSGTRVTVDPALISIIATIVGSLFFSLLGGAVGLFLAYRALQQARATGGTSGSEKLAKTAVIVGWIGVAAGVLPLCMILPISGVQFGYSFCDELFQELLDMLPAGIGG